ncbi:molybdenum cofactor biosynthesis protein 1-like protein [Sarcoptes scabiei]|uniref:Molybdenum cofactor biosynthesis protein 1-like protein n=1 Tax=Sarcoptes scabiei TaxID=52283 RepID=A0A132AHE7_SARSC|nr:molybdenum cofactor biosynthesis protein 1-like protein [Sarcoptes scabiei]
MPENGITLSPQSNLLTNDEIIKSANLFVKKFGIKKIRLTGGEPLIRKDIVEIVSNLSRLKACGLETISMTTNGILFERYDRSLWQAGLDSVNISLDTLKNDRYLRITRRNGLEKVLSSIEKALENSYESVKINCVLIDGFNQDEIVDFVELTKTKKIEIRFIELMPFIGNNWSKEKMISYSRLMAIIESHYRTDLKRLKPRSMNDTAILYQINGYDGVIGLINSMTKPFCSGCNRIRITADGSIKNCLFGKEEFSLRDAIRNGFDESEITNLIKTSIASKKRSHAGFAKIFNDKSNRPMILIDQRRFYSSDNKSNENEFSHIDTETNRIKMVDVSDKKVTQRNAHARAKIKVSRIVFDKIQSNQIAKGDVLTTAKLAAISAAKMTSHLIPLCHPIPLEHIEVKFQFDPSQNEIDFDHKSESEYPQPEDRDFVVTFTI